MAKTTLIIMHEDYTILKKGFTEMITLNTCPLCKELVCACDASKDTAIKIRLISAKDLKKMIEQSLDILIINVLTKEFYDDCHIKGSINFPLNQLEQVKSELDKNKTIIVYCANKMCSASKAAFKIFALAGFKNIFAFEGGVQQWKAKGFPTEGACKASYLK